MVATADSRAEAEAVEHELQAATVELAEPVNLRAEVAARDAAVLAAVAAEAQLWAALSSTMVAQ
jgi:hypothetical protein